MRNLFRIDFFDARCFPAALQIVYLIILPIPIVAASISGWLILVLGAFPQSGRSASRLASSASSCGHWR